MPTKERGSLCIEAAHGFAEAPRKREALRMAVTRTAPDPREPSQLRHLWELICTLTAAELKARYRRSLLGFFWSLIAPLFQVVIVAFLFRVLWPHDIPDFTVKYFCGLLPWIFFSDCVLGACPTFLKFRDVLKKIYFPRWVLPISVVASSLVHFGLSLVVLFAVFLVIPVAFDVSFLFLLVLIAILLVMVVGLSLLFSVLHTFYEDTQYGLQALLRAWFFLTPVFYPASEIPSQYRHLYLYNPMATICEGFRGILLEHKLPQPEHLLATLGVGALCLALGGLYYRRYGDHLPEVL
jgi:lipopolysaccharide transport system permease protein